MAKHVGTTQAQINGICRGKRGISAVMPIGRSRALGASAEYSLNLQLVWELSQVQAEYEDIEPLAEHLAPQRGNFFLRSAGKRRSEPRRRDTDFAARTQQQETFLRQGPLQNGVRHQ
jgi:plasmid maintenance system antidote protein VapI